VRSFNFANTAQIIMEESGHSNSYVGMGMIKRETASRLESLKHTLDGCQIIKQGGDNEKVLHLWW
jgi:hypothetical protein